MATWDLWSQLKEPGLWVARRLAQDKGPILQLQGRPVPFLSLDSQSGSWWDCLFGALILLTVLPQKSYPTVGLSFFLGCFLQSAVNMEELLLRERVKEGCLSVLVFLKERRKSREIHSTSYWIINKQSRNSKEGLKWAAPRQRAAREGSVLG